jgi:flagellar FliL protein
MSNEQESRESPAAPPAPKKGGWFGIGLIALLAVGGGGAGAWFLLLSPKPSADPELAAAHAASREPIYVTLAENLVVNFRSPGGTRFLQVGIDLMTYDEAGVHALEKHAAVLRSDLILLLSDQPQEALLSREGKEALREAALAEIRKDMTELHGSAVAESLYFTTFVMQ